MPIFHYEGLTHPGLCTHVKFHVSTLRKGGGWHDGYVLPDGNFTLQHTGSGGGTTGWVLLTTAEINWVMTAVHRRGRL